MKKLSVLFVTLFLGLSAGVVNAAEDGAEKKMESGNYIPWTWDDVQD